MEYYLNIDPKTLSDAEWAAKFEILCDIRKKESKVDNFK